MVIIAGTKKENDFVYSTVKGAARHVLLFCVEKIRSKIVGLWCVRGNSSSFANGTFLMTTVRRRCGQKSWCIIHMPLYCECGRIVDQWSWSHYLQYSIFIENCLRIMYFREVEWNYVIFFLLNEMNCGIILLQQVYLPPFYMNE